MNPAPFIRTLALVLGTVAFAGPGKKTLYVVGAGAVYKAPMIAEGIKSRAK